MRALPLADASCVAVASFYSLIHLLRDEVPVALAEIRRVLRPGGTVVLAVHGGVDEIHVEDWFGKPVTFDATLFGGDELLGLLDGAGFSERLATQREPYPREHPTPRLYVQATRP